MSGLLMNARGVSFGYGGRDVLREVSVSLAAGEVVGLIGPNGSGKSTLIKVLGGHLRAGGVEWLGRALGQYSRRELAKVVAYLPQAPTYDADHTVADVLRLGRAPYLGALGIESAHDVAAVVEAARRLELTELLDRPMVQLSGGQRQRAFIGRCLVQEPRALLLDEPNTYLDLRHQVELLALVRELAHERGMGVITASHELNLLGGFVDRLVLLGEGQVLAEGTSDRVLRGRELEGAYGVPMERLERDGTVVVIPRRAK